MERPIRAKPKPFAVFEIVSITWLIMVVSMVDVFWTTSSTDFVKESVTEKVTVVVFASLLEVFSLFDKVIIMDCLANRP